MNIEQIKSKVTEQTRRSSFCKVTIDNTDFHYVPLNPPIADDEELCETFDRIMLCHSRQGLSIVKAPKGVMNYGWVIGVLP